MEQTPPLARWLTLPSDPQADRAAWERGLALYDASSDENYALMLESCDLMCQALRHHPRGTEILANVELGQTILNVLIAATAVPPDGRTMVPAAKEAIRLALHVIRAKSWQHTNLRGDGMIGFLFEDRGTWMLYTEALAPMSIRDFFAAEGLPAVPFR